MVKQIKKSVKEVIVKKPKEAPITPTQPSQPETKSEKDILQIAKESIVENKELLDKLAEPIAQKDIVYTDTSPIKKRKKRETKPIEQPKQLEPLAEKKGRGTSFYVGLGFGIVIASVGIYFLYMKFKEWSNDPQRKEDNLIKQLEKEGVKSLENIRKE